MPAAQDVTINNWDDLADVLRNNPALVMGSIFSSPADTAKFQNLASVTTSGATVARNAASVTGAPALNLLSRYNVAVFVLNVISAATEVGDTLDVFVDLSLDSFTWFNAVHFTQVLGNGGAKIFVAQLTHPSAAVADINVTADAAANAVRNLWAPHVRIGWATTDANANTNAIFSFRVDVYLQAV